MGFYSGLTKKQFRSFIFMKAIFISTFFTFLDKDFGASIIDDIYYLLGHILFVVIPLKFLFRTDGEFIRYFLSLNQSNNEVKIASKFVSI